MNEYIILVKIKTKANDSEEAEQNAWEFLSFCNREDISFYIFEKGKDYDSIKEILENP